jgi:hypothetical protein
MALPRSGSSMVAGIFAIHGVWTGPYRTDTRRNTKGSFEGEAIRNVMLWAYGRRVVGAGRPVEPRGGLRAVIENAIRTAGYVDGPWLWKGSALFYPAWHEFQPKVVVCRRDPEASLRSAMQPPYVYDRDPGLAWQSICLHNAELDKLVAAGAHEVDTQAVALGDFATIRSAVEGCGLRFDERATAEFVDPSMWHHKA